MNKLQRGILVGEKEEESYVMMQLFLRRTRILSDRTMSRLSVRVAQICQSVELPIF